MAKITSVFVNQVLTMVEARAEQIFDKIQENPRVTRDDYVLIKYFENLCQLIEKADKLVNHCSKWVDKPHKVHWSRDKHLDRRMEFSTIPTARPTLSAQPELERLDCYSIFSRFDWPDKPLGD